MLRDGRLVGLGELLHMDVRQCDGVVRYLVGSSGCRAYRQPGGREEMSSLTPGKTFSLVAECGGFGKVWLDLAPERACAATTMVAWVNLCECERLWTPASAEAGREAPSLRLEQGITS